MDFVNFQEHIITTSVVFFLGTLIGFVLLANFFKDRVIRTYGFFYIVSGFWALLTISFDVYVNVNQTLAKYFLFFSISFVPIISVIVVNFGIAYYETHIRSIKNVKLFQSLNYYLASTFLLITLLDTFSPAGFIMSFDGIPAAGPLMPLAFLHFIGAPIISGILILQGARQKDTTLKKESILIASALVLTFLFSSILFAPWYGIYINSWINTITAPLFTLFITYILLKDKTFVLKAIISQVLVFSIWIALFVRMILEIPSPQALIDLLLLVAIIFLGSYLIRTIQRDIGQNTKVEKLAKKLTELNTRLEEKVTKRTKTLDELLLHTDTLIEELPIGIIEYDKEFRLIRINSLAESVLGIKRSEVINELIEPNKLPKEGYKSLVEITYPFLADSAVKVAHPNDEEDVTDTHEMQLTFPNDKDVQVITLPFVSPDGEEETGIIKMVRDITREKAIDRSKSEFISVAAHKMRTPLSGVKWALRFVLDGDAGAINEKQKSFIMKSYQTNDDMIKLVNDMLDVARIEKGELEYDMRTNSITELVYEVVKRNRDEAENNSLLLAFKVPEQAVPPFVFDKDRVITVIEHLISNAIKYTPEKGSITVTLHPVTPDKKVIIDIDDTGIGIPEKQRNMLFTKFFRSDEAMHMHTEGSGLGLLISKEIMTKHNGEITLLPRDEGGTRARIVLPMDNVVDAN